jgi:AcrR family transcriptional regulator
VGAERRAELVQAAGRLLDAEGPEALTMRRLADALGIRAPSLYKHLPGGKDDLHRALVVEALTELGERMQAAVDAEPGSLAAVARAYRRYALDRPHRYRLLTDVPLPAGDDVRGAELEARGPLDAVLGLDEHRGRALWAFAHGMVDLELRGRFPAGADLDAAWAAGVAGFEPGRSVRRVVAARR